LDWWTEEEEEGNGSSELEAGEVGREGKSERVRSDDERSPGGKKWTKSSENRKC
jgi:hypothetical protein